jgi:hypothetical protein
MFPGAPNTTGSSAFIHTESVQWTDPSIRFHQTGKASRLHEGAIYDAISSGCEFLYNLRLPTQPKLGLKSELSDASKEMFAGNIWLRVSSL